MAASRPNEPPKNTNKSQKIERCPQKSHCTHGLTCEFRHNALEFELFQNNGGKGVPKYRIEMCMHRERCPRKDRCRFAHNQSEYVCKYCAVTGDHECGSCPKKAIYDNRPEEERQTNANVKTESTPKSLDLLKKETKDLDSLKAEIKTETTKNSELNKNLIVVEKEIASLKSEKKAETDKNAVLSEQLAVAKLEIQQLKNQVAEDREAAIAIEGTLDKLLSELSLFRNEAVVNSHSDKKDEPAVKARTPAKTTLFAHT